MTRRASMVDLAWKRIANLVPNATTMRNPGARGVVSAARRYLRRIDLPPFAQGDFDRTLDRHTIGLVRVLPAGARHWGVARKALNLLLEEAFYNRFLTRAYGLRRLESRLEVPMDRQVADGLRAERGWRRLPRWPGVKHLTAEEHRAFNPSRQKCQGGTDCRA